MRALACDGRVDRLRRRAEDGILVGTMGRRLVSSQSFGSGWLWWVWLGLLGAGCGWAQQTSPANDAPITTLHVYTNLAQVPTLVLTTKHKEMTLVAPAQFRLSLDSGPAVPPTHVRVEGDDPISMAILIDTMVPKSQLLPQVQEAVTGLAHGSLGPQDRVSIYAMGCDLTLAADQITPDAKSLENAMNTAMATWANRQRAGSGVTVSSAHSRTCKPLWDALSYVTERLHQQPGRRVLIAISDGVDSGSNKATWWTVQERAQIESVATFGVLTTGSKEPEDPFDSICELTGGVELFATNRTLDQTLQELVTMVRHRYILEFPRSDDFKPGHHSIAVSILKTKAYIQTTGVTFPVADPKVLADPTTLHPEVEAPEPGARRILSPPPK
jgi:hypothetical protein